MQCQACRRCCVGVAGRVLRSAAALRGDGSFLGEDGWKAAPQRVTAPYPKGMIPGLNAHPSSTGHEESRVNPGGPPSKAKYHLATDSEAVP